MPKETISILAAPEAQKVKNGEMVIVEQKLMAPPIKSKLDVEKLADNLSDFLNKYGKVMDKIPASLGNFSVDNVTVSLGISASGDVSILGIGGSLGADASITISFSKPK